MDPEEGVIDRRYKAYGAAADFIACRDLEVLCESGAGTGKTRSLLEKARFLCENYRNVRGVFARMTRKSMNDTILPIWQEEVLWPGHRAIHGTASMAHRETYFWPDTNSVITLHDLAHVDRILSGQHDFIYIYQAEELLEEEVWEKMATRLRAGHTPYGQLAADVNPASEQHWLNQRAYRQICVPCWEGLNRDLPDAVEMENGQCPDCESPEWRYQVTRICYRHEDNPRWFDHEKGDWRPEGKVYVGQTLGSLRGVRRERYRNHRWVAEEGLILEDFDPLVHVIDGELEEPSPETGIYWQLKVKGKAEPIVLKWFGAGVDWGYFPDPGVISVWGYDDFGNRYMVAEVYRTKWLLDKWVEVAEHLRDAFDLRYFACDPSRPDMREGFNKRFQEKHNHRGPALAIKADNTLRAKPKAAKKDLVGIDLMLEGIRDPDGKARTFFLRDCLWYGQDQELRKAGKPTCGVQEITQWVWAKNADGKPMNHPDESCDDHWLDSWRYEESVGWGKYLARGPKKSKHAPGTAGYILGHNDP